MKAFVRESGGILTSCSIPGPGSIGSESAERRLAVTKQYLKKKEMNKSVHCEIS